MDRRTDQQIDRDTERKTETVDGQPNKTSTKSRLRQGGCIQYGSI